MRTRGILLTHVILNLLHLWVKYLSQRYLFLFFGNVFPNIWFPQGAHYTTHLEFCNSAYQEWIYACDDNTSYHKGFCPRHLYVWHPTCEPLWHRRLQERRKAHIQVSNVKICFRNTSQTMQCINTIYLNTFEKQSVSESNALLREFMVYHTSLLVLPHPGVIQP